MASNGDSRPFVVLRQDAEHFRNSFDDDVKSCVDLLDSKLTALICDPDSIGTPPKEAGRLSAHLEFTKAKYDVFMSIKSLFGEMEESWKEQIAQMRHNFLENVEILLASTKLETTLAGNKNSSSILKEPKGQKTSSPSITSSLYPYSLLQSTAKRIPVLNSLLSRDEERKNVVEMNDTGVTSIRGTPSTSMRTMNSHIEEDESSEEDNEAQVVRTPIKQVGRPPKNSDIPTPLTHNSSLVQNTYIEDFEEDESNDEENGLQIVRTPPKQVGRPRKNANILNVNKDSSAIRRKAKETVATPPVSKTLLKNAGKGRKSILKTDPAYESELHTTPSRSTRKRTAIKETNPPGNNENDMECSESDYEVTSAAPKTPKNVHFSVGLDVHEDLEIYSPEVTLSRSAPRRKTMISAVSDSFSDVNLTPDVNRSKSKRKTICGSAMDVSVVPSPKRFKRGGRASSAVFEEPEEDSDHLESDVTTATEHYTPWLPLSEFDGKVPAVPGIYELKVYKAKKSAYIGSCDNLRQKLTLHKIGQNSGHKHLDKFLERNKTDVQVRYVKMPSAQEAKKEEMNRIHAFVTQHKTTPAYN